MPKRGRRHDRRGTDGHFPHARLGARRPRRESEPNRQNREKAQRHKGAKQRHGNRFACASHQSTSAVLKHIARELRMHALSQIVYSLERVDQHVFLAFRQFVRVNVIADLLTGAEIG